MTFEAFKDRARKHLSNSNIEISDEELLKLFVSNIVLEEFLQEQYKKELKVLKNASLTRER